MSILNVCLCGETRKYQYIWIEKSIYSRAMCKPNHLLHYSNVDSLKKYMFSVSLTVAEALPGVLGNKKKNKNIYFRGTLEQREQGNKGKFGEQGT